MTLAAELNQALRPETSRVLNVCGGWRLGMRRSRAVASLAFDPGPHIAFGIGCVAIEAFGGNFCRRSLAERSLYIGRRAATVADGQPRAVTRGVPRNPMLEIRAVDRPHGCDPTN